MSIAEMPRSALSAAPLSHELVHAAISLRHRKDVLHAAQQVVGIEHRVFAHAPQSLGTVGADVAVRPHQHAHVAEKAAHAADRFGPIVIQAIAVAVALDDAAPADTVPACAVTAIGPAPGPPPPCGPLNVLCGLKCIMSAPKSPGRADAQNGVHVGAVQIHQPAGGVYRSAMSAMWRSNMPSVLGLVIMNTAVWSSSLASQVVQVDEALGVLLTVTVVEAGHGGAGRIGAVSAVGREHLRARCSPRSRK